MNITSPAVSAPGRLLWLDALRGLAIFTMVCANMAGLLGEAPTALFRWYGSFAAPLFIALAGYSVALTRESQGRDCFYSWKRGIAILLIGAALDVVAYRIVPFTTVDVLYLIGVAIPLAYAAAKLPARGVLLLTLVFFALAPLAQALFGYADYPTEYYLSGKLTTEVANQTSIFNHWLVDGWFPVIPWMGFALLGVWMHQSRERSCLLQGFVLFGLGLGLCWTQPGAMLIRDVYSEVFYPPTFGFLLLASGVVLLLAEGIRRAERARAGRLVFHVFAQWGHASLLMYLFHILVIARVLKPWLEPMSYLPYLGTYLSLVVVMLGLGAWLRKFKDRRGGKSSFCMRLVLGG